MIAGEIKVSDVNFENIKIDSLIIENKYVDENGNANLPINKFMRVVDTDVYIKIERFTDETTDEVEHVFAKIKGLKTIL